MPKPPVVTSEQSHAEMTREILLRLLLATEGAAFGFPPQMLQEIEAISIQGADPDWRVGELRKIIERWMAQA